MELEGREVLGTDLEQVAHTRLSAVGGWMREMAVSWNDVHKVVELVLWSMLSMADVVNSPLLNLDGHTTPLQSYLQFSNANN